jgi:hypothetical protein
MIIEDIFAVCNIILGGKRKGEKIMKVGFKLLTFCLISIFLIISYHTAVRPAVKNSPPPLQVPSFGSNNQIKVSDLFARININNKNKNSNFAVAQITKTTNSFKITFLTSAQRDALGFTTSWASKNQTLVTLYQPEQQIIDYLKSINNLPTASMINNANDNKFGKWKTNLRNLETNFKSVLLYFTASDPNTLNVVPSATNNYTIYYLFITNPNPGKIIQAGQTFGIPMLSVLKAWTLPQAIK